MSPKFARHRPLAPVLLLWYLRAMAGVFLLSGLGNWAVILGADGGSFEDLPVHVQGAVIYFALIEVIAAVGLWCGAAWGVTAWLFAAVAALVMQVGFSDLFGASWAVATFHVLTIAGYIGLAWWTGAAESTSEVLRLPPD